MALSSLAAELELAGEDGFDTSDHLHHASDVGIGLGASLAEEFGMEDGETLAELDDNYDNENKEAGLSHTPPTTSNGIPHTYTPDQEQRRTGKSSTESYHTIPISRLSTPADDERYEEVEEFMIPSMESSPVPPHSFTFGSAYGNASKSTSSRLVAQTSTLSLRTKVKAQPFIIPQNEAQGQDALIVLSETLATTSRLLRDLRSIDGTATATASGSGSGSGSTTTEDTNAIVNVEDGLQKYLGKMLDSERTREEQLRQLGIIGREMNAIGGWEHELDMELNLDFPEYIKGDGDGEEKKHIGWTGEAIHENENNSGDGNGVRVLVQSPSIASSLTQNLHDNPIMEDDDMDGINSHDALLKAPFSDKDIEIESNTTRGSSLPLQSLAMTNTSSSIAMGRLPGMTHQLISETNSLIHVIVSLSDTLHNSTSMSTSIQRQIRGINSSIQGWREREESEDRARKLIEDWENERVRKGLLGERSTKDLLGEMCIDFKGKLDSWGEKMDHVRREVTA